MDIADSIIPRALVTAARTFADRPEVVGGILVHLVTGKGRKLSEVQSYVVAACEDELRRRAESRESARVRKARSRAAGKESK